MDMQNITDIYVHYNVDICFFCIAKAQQIVSQLQSITNQRREQREDIEPAEAISNQQIN
jgi:hypothetical protein